MRSRACPSEKFCVRIREGLEIRLHRRCFPTTKGGAVEVVWQTAEQRNGPASSCGNSQAPSIPDSLRDARADSSGHPMPEPPRCWYPYTITLRTLSRRVAQVLSSIFLFRFCKVLGFKVRKSGELSTILHYLKLWSRHGNPAFREVEPRRRGWNRRFPAVASRLHFRWGLPLARLVLAGVRSGPR
jgi:hypothetical protein